MSEKQGVPAASEVAPGVFRLEKVLPSGWGNTMLLFKAPGGGVVVHSPTWLGPGTFERVEEVGRPVAILAPNYFHHLSVPRFRERYPEAAVLATKTAMPRLTKQGHKGLADVAERADLLPEGSKILVCEGSKTGEVWLSLPGGAGKGPTLAVCDGIFNVERPTTGAMGLVLRLTQSSPGLQLGKTIRWLAMADRPAFVEWAVKTIGDLAPGRIVMSHGEPLEAPDLANRLSALVRERLG
jgi:hypothetical protein